MKILILCTGNSARSQMAEGFLKTFNPQLEVYSAGTYPAERVNPNAVKVMSEEKVDINNNYPKNVDQFLAGEYDYVITVCDKAKETCPLFSGKVKNILHMGFDDPADAGGTEEEILAEFRRVRNEIKESFMNFYKKEIQPQVDKL